MVSSARIMKSYFSYELPFSIIHVSNLEIKTSLLPLMWQVDLLQEGDGLVSFWESWLRDTHSICLGQWLSPYLGKEKDMLLPTLAFCDFRTQVKSMPSLPQNFLRLLIKSKF